MKPSILLFISALSSTCFAEDIQHNDGIYSKTYNDTINTGLVYHADSKTQLCFASSHTQTNRSMEQIACASLAKRDEWQPILTWLPTATLEAQASYRPHR